MKAPCCGYFALVSLLALPCALAARDYAFEDLSSSEFNVAPAVPAAPQPNPGQYIEAQQYIPPDNNEPGFQPEPEEKSEGVTFSLGYIHTGIIPTYLKISPESADQLPDRSGKCALTPATRYNLRSAPVFEGQHLLVNVQTPLPGCAFQRGYVYMPHVYATSAGGLWQLPANVKAFLDTLAYAEGTKEHYNYMFTFRTFSSYTDHPREKICSHGLCSTAAGRYQFLAKTWDSLADRLALPDFSPPNQEKATLEILRRLGAYTAISNASVYNNFAAAIAKANRTWASLPGSPYGQPTHSIRELWNVYNDSLAHHRRSAPANTQP